ncbi:flagellar hook-length control protein FliK [Microbacteriaceae bacterium 4G12]
MKLNVLPVQSIDFQKENYSKQVEKTEDENNPKTFLKTFDKEQHKGIESTTKKENDKKKADNALHTTSFPAATMLSQAMPLGTPVGQADNLAFGSETLIDQVNNLEALIHKETIATQPASLAPIDQNLLLSVSNQVMALEQLKDKPDALQQLLLLIQHLSHTYGDMPFKQLKEEDLKKLQTMLGDNGMQALLCMDDTVNQLMRKVTAFMQSTAPMPSQVIVEQYDLTRDYKNNLLNFAPTNLHSTVEEAKNISDNSKEHNISIEQFNSLFGKVDGDNALKTTVPEKVTISGLNNKIQEQIEEIQKFAVKNERIFVQLTPEKFGEVNIYLKKQANQIDVHVELTKKEVKEKIAVIFEDVKTRLKEKDIHIELSYTQRDGKHEQKERNHPGQQKHENKSKKQESSEPKFEGLWEEISND